MDVHTLGRLAATVRRHYFPEQFVVVEATAVIAYASTMLRYMGENFLNTFLLQVCAFDSGIQLRGISCVVLCVVDFHGARVDMRLQGVIGVR